MSDHYTIRTIADLFDVPRDRWDAMLVDLRAWMDLTADTVDALAGQLSEHLGTEVTPMKQFTWCDDGVVGFNGTVTLHIADDEAAGADQ